MADPSAVIASEPQNRLRYKKEFQLTLLPHQYPYHWEAHPRSFTKKKIKKKKKKRS
jgi:hypothetical protein